MTAREKLSKLIIDGIIHDEFYALFFSQVPKVPVSIQNALGFITVTKEGLLLGYDPDFIENATPSMIKAFLVHELFHVILEHFYRKSELATLYNIPFVTFSQKYGIYTDLPTNMLTKQYCHDEHIELTQAYSALEYDSIAVKQMGIDEKKHDTYEKIVRYLRDIESNNNKDEDEESEEDTEGKDNGNGNHGKGNENEDNSSESVVVVVVDDHNNIISKKEIIKGRSDKTIVIVDQISNPDIAEKTREQIADLIEQSARNAGDLPKDMQELINNLVDNAKPKQRALTGWELFKYLLIGERSASENTISSFTRLNRRTGELPGKMREKEGYNCLMIIDESGSVNNEEILIAVETTRLVKQQSNDKIYILPFDTEPGEVKEVNEVDLDNFTREKCGGTNFSNMFVNSVVGKLDYDVVIILTDGYPSHFPEVPSGCDEYWLVTTDEGAEACRNYYAKDNPLATVIKV